MAYTSGCTSASSGVSWDCASILLISGALNLIDAEYSASALSDGFIIIIIIIIIIITICLERYRKVVGRDWCHMSFGIIAENVLAGYSQNPSQSLGHLKVTGGDLMFKDDSSKPCRSCV